MKKNKVPNPPLRVSGGRIPGKRFDEVVEWLDDFYISQKLTLPQVSVIYGDVLSKPEIDKIKSFFMKKREKKINKQYEEPS